MTEPTFTHKHHKTLAYIIASSTSFNDLINKIIKYFKNDNYYFNETRYREYIYNIKQSLDSPCIVTVTRSHVEQIKNKTYIPIGILHK